ncbi:MAG: hypothetical protein A2939_05680 [Parcubacteria group bacterium RIFCSPLOWO2_01_FULL_48_18]|nr:MAG: hypothetical protein A2939_05680 [Parcubacteria group bacterium RIFCSPLOWO2_01_FULL_48_18]
MFSAHNFSSASYLRNFIFGVEDSLVSTVGLLSGVAITGAEARTVFATGIILIFVEAFSMAVGSFLSEHSAEEFMQKNETPLRQSLFLGGVMFVSYFVAGFVPLLPYVFFPLNSAFWYSIGFSLLALFLLGVFSARLSKINFVKGGARMLIIGGIAIAVGVLVGRIATNL